MKRLFLVETTTGDRWEICSGFHLVMAENKDEAEEITKKEVKPWTIVSVVDVAKEMKNKTFKTILTPQVE